MLESHERAGQSFVASDLIQKSIGWISISRDDDSICMLVLLEYNFLSCSWGRDSEVVSSICDRKQTFKWNFVKWDIPTEHKMEQHFDWWVTTSDGNMKSPEYDFISIIIAINFTRGILDPLLTRLFLSQASQNEELDDVALSNSINVETTNPLLTQDKSKCQENTEIWHTWGIYSNSSKGVRRNKAKGDKTNCWIFL